MLKMTAYIPPRRVNVQRIVHSLTALLIIISGTALAYERIISLAPSITRDIYLLNLQDKLVGVTMYCPDFAKNKENIGSVLAPNMERIASLKPDLVLATKDGNDRRTVDKLKSMGINVYVMEAPTTFDDICSGFMGLGRYLSVETKAGKIVNNARKRVKAARLKIPPNASNRVFWQVGANPIFTASAKSFVNEFMALSGAENIFGGLSARYPQVTREAVVAANPDTIIIVSMNGEMSTEKANWARFGQMSAVENGRVFFVNDMIFDNPTPAAIAEGVEKLLPILYPKTK